MLLAIAANTIAANTLRRKREPRVPLLLVLVLFARICLGTRTRAHLVSCCTHPRHKHTLVCTRVAMHSGRRREVARKHFVITK
jgi:hypothetical protein